MTAHADVPQWRRDHVRYNFDRRRGPVETSFFAGGRTNIAYNCLDRHIEAGRGGQPCFLWEVPAWFPAMPQALPPVTAAFLA